MSSPIEVLKLWADYAMGFAWPMLWQSSLLIAVVLALDFGLRKKLRPAAQYLVWIFVLINASSIAEDNSGTNSAAGVQGEVHVHVRGRFFEVPADWAESFWTLLKTNGPGITRPLTGFLTQPQTSVLEKELEQVPGAALLSESSITTLSGRQSQMLVGDFQTVVNTRALAPPGISSEAEKRGELFQEGAMHSGTVLDFTPWVSADAREITLTVNATIKEFVGYADSAKTQEVTVYVDGQPRRLGMPRRPITRTQQMEAKVRMEDGQVLVIVGEPGTPDPARPANKRRIVLLTPVAVDSAGNRLNGPDKTPAK